MSNHQAKSGHKELPPELPASVLRLRLVALIAAISSIWMFYGAVHAIDGGDWLGGLRGPLAILVVPVALLFPRLAAPWAAAIQCALGVVALFAAIAAVAISREGAAALKREEAG